MYNIGSIIDELGISAEVVARFAVIALIAAVIGLVISVITYVFQAVGFYSVAKRRGISGAWLAWFPVAQYWVAGSIADNYQSNINRKNTNFRLILLLLAISGSVIDAVVSGNAVNNLLDTFRAIAEMDSSAIYQASAETAAVGGIMGLLNSALEIALMVFWHISLYNFYCSCCPNYKAAFVILGILFPITVPFFLFCNRKKDEGMIPPQYAAPAGYTPYQSANNYTEYL